MKSLKTLFFIFWALKLSGQYEDVTISNGQLDSSEIKGDFSFSVGSALFKNKGIIKNSNMFAYQMSLSVRFKYHLYTSFTFSGAKELTIDIFGLMPVPDKITKISLVGGGHFSGDFFYISLGAGLSRQNGQVWDFNANQVQILRNFGLETKVQGCLYLTKSMAVGLGYNYNHNNIRDYQSILIGLHFSRLN
jgi:hypothetical protein